MVNKKSDRLLLSLFKYYITFVLVLAGIFFASYIYIGYKMSKNVEEANVPILDIINGNNNDYINMNKEDLVKIEGYIEILDEDRRVIETVGKSQVAINYQYNEQELLDIIGMNKEDDKYYVLLNTFTRDNKKYRALVRIPTKNISIVLNLFSVPYSVGKPLYALYLKVIGVAFILSVISIAIYSFWTAKKIKKPLTKIDDALGKIIEGDYSEKLVLDDAKEFVLVSNTINFLVDKLKKSNEENKRLEESKTRMLIDLSHDIKTPITSIKGFSAALYEGIVDSEEQKERYYKTIYTKSEKVTELVDDWFEYVKMDSTQYKLILESVDICEFVRQIVVGYVDEIEEKNFELVVNIPDRAEYLQIDTRLFKRVITNIIENAIKYNDEGTRIKIEIRNVGKFLVIEIADNGRGISEGLREKIFDPFVRGDESRRTDGGSGLGLAIAKKIVDSHEGEISLISRRDNYKTIFNIRLHKIN